jgi:hypothetical protein
MINDYNFDEYDNEADTVSTSGSYLEDIVEDDNVDIVSKRTSEDMKQEIANKISKKYCLSTPISNNPCIWRFRQSIKNSDSYKRCLNKKVKISNADDKQKKNYCILQSLDSEETVPYSKNPMPKKNEKDRRLFKQWVRNNERDINLINTGHNESYFLRNRGGRKSKKNSKKSKRNSKKNKRKTTLKNELFTS